MFLPDGGASWHGLRGQGKCSVKQIKSGGVYCSLVSSAGLGSRTVKYSRVKHCPCRKSGGLNARTPSKPTAVSVSSVAESTSVEFCCKIVKRVRSSMKQVNDQLEFGTLRVCGRKHDPWPSLLAVQKAVKRKNARHVCAAKDRQQQYNLLNGNVTFVTLQIRV